MVATDLFFSEYVEGSSNNKALEIANFTGGNIDLSEYSIEIYFNGSTTAGSTLNLSGTLSDADVYVIADNDSVQAILDEADLTPTSSFFNGDDAIALLKNGVIIDVIGQIGFDPGNEWGSGDASTQNNTLRRQSSVVAGDPDGSDAFDPSIEWDGFPQDTFDGLGSHSIDNGTPTPDISINELRISSPGGSDDDSNFVELFGAEGTALDGVSLVALSGEFNPGLVNNVFDLNGLSIDEDGFLLVANSSIANAIPQAITEANDLLEEFDFFGSPATFLLVQNFTGTEGDDLDADDDGVLDAAIGTVIDSVSLSNTAGAPDQNYSDTVIVADGNFPPAGIARDVDGTGTFQPLEFGSFAADTPGFSNEAPPPPAEITKIYTIQGEAHTSALVGQAVTTTGIVTAVDSNGFYLQDAVGDDNIATSDALFVFTGSAPGVSVGDELQVEGMVSEFTPGGTSTRNLSTTQISGSPTITTLSTGNALPAATIIGASGRVVPNQNIDDDAFGSFDPTTDGIDFFESLEGMLVTAEDLVAVAGTNRFGEIFAVANQGANATGISDRGTLNISPDDFNPEKIQIDTDPTISGFDNPETNVGDVLGDVTGVVSYSFGNFEILPTEDFTGNITSAGLTQETTSLVGSADQLTVASYNVLNLDPNDGDGDADVANGRFDAIAQQIVNNLNAPDIIGLQEVQDNNGSVNDGTTAADETLQLLVDAIAAAGGPAYEFIDNTFIGNNQSGGQPGGNIRTAFLYNPNRVGVVPGSVQAIGGQEPGQAFEGARLPIVADFTFNGETVTVVNNHFSSKGGSAPILGVEQPFDERQEDVTVNGSLDERQRQSQAIQNFVNGLADNANVVVVGDFNEFEFVSPVEGLETNSGLTNLTNTLPEDERYSFIFQGNSQSLDHILVSENLAADTQFDVVHTNVEFAETDSRASDHDPLLVALSLPASEPNVINGTRNDDDIRGTNEDDVIAGNDGDDSIRGRGGNDTIEGGRGGDIIRGGAGDDILAADRVDRFQDFDGDISEIRGGSGNDTIFGGSKNDLLIGGGDNDVLFGKSGDDTLSGNSGDDLLNGGVGNDDLNGGGGVDTADYSDLAINGVFGTVAGLDANLRTREFKHSSTNNALTWTDTVRGIENVIGTQRNDRFIGNGQDNIFDGQGEVGRSDRQTQFTDQRGVDYTVIADVVEYRGSMSDFTFSGTADNFTATSNQDGTDTLIDIEFVRFNRDGMTVATSDLAFA